MPSCQTPTAWRSTHQQPLEHVYRDGEQNLPSGVQPMEGALHSKCNIEHQRSINCIQLIQVETNTPLQTMLPVSSTPRRSFNNCCPSSSSSRGCAGDDAWVIVGQVAPSFERGPCIITAPPKLALQTRSFNQRLQPPPSSSTLTCA